MVKRLMLTALLLTALFTSAVRLSAAVCPVLGAPIGKACQMGSCASKSCCADSQKNHKLPSTPLAKDSGSNYELVAVVTPTIATAPTPISALELSSRFSAADIIVSAPKPALLCTFLI
jgi:hypothetical protein